MQEGSPGNKSDNMFRKHAYASTMNTFKLSRELLPSDIFEDEGANSCSLSRLGLKKVTELRK